MRGKSWCLQGLSQRIYISKVLQRFDRSTCKDGDSPMSKGDKLHTEQCPRNEVERKDMKKKLYARLINLETFTGLG